MNPFGTICGVFILISKLLYVTVYFVMKNLIYTEKGYISTLEIFIRKY